MVVEIIIISVISLLILYFRNNKINLCNFDIEIKGHMIFIVVAAIEAAAQFLFKKNSSSEILQVLSFYWLIYPAILIVSLINIKKNYMKIFFIGTLLNFTAIAGNNFKMPVQILGTTIGAEKTAFLLKSGKDLIHSFLTGSTRFKILCDIITIPPPYPFVKTISIGDILLLIGVFLFWQETYKNRKNLHSLYNIQ